MAWFTKTKVSEPSQKKTLGEGVFRRCDTCGATLKAEEFEANLEVCPGCGHHYRLSAEAWIELLLDPGSWVEHDAGLQATDPLGFVDSKPYRQRLEASRKKTGHQDALLAGDGTLNGRPIQLGVFLFRFMGGSMGSVVGEKITRLFERGLEKNQPVVLLSASGGARMQEGALSLMQMAKTVAALGRLRDAGLPFISVLLHPTTGGVAASYALLGDVNIAEPRALIGFAGPRVIEQTIRQKLPEGFQRAEFLLEHGMVDRIAHRHEMRATIARLLSHFLD
ncbi:MAG TPA: acetyl-CoA carboxylase, carboxyltransferase subunit beta [Polyangiaceae bacterium LLY-WYZ-15_(1-7)]|nr:acetyl-CoA carboxylase carboxyl transferase subunit beta [Myxococcales bacterium]MAT25135.1 acetyl-CoA carboxylase carboxyl transferase subunit beta [Sandaracinus sp.]HJK90217.1 acetyl-CoA carboxylase, carboxyltransferase subunit beta [Polyangiaceae bacterium LLY-WYZ-15_(1-7)]HJL01892.1 acetyl-CoA carboxylase, carboxyltransferase subunit beta [Polyangiaceae bacterium LLY-WYZ-15_(1-7)]HJL11569.1 acetyl-CoA carboxylase, carboxyltransferase subunit beta [Polyangiaceae bacterium LLY-WYZ-15_(1-7)